MKMMLKGGVEIVVSQFLLTATPARLRQRGTTNRPPIARGQAGIGAEVLHQPSRVNGDLARTELFLQPVHADADRAREEANEPVLRKLSPRSQVVDVALGAAQPFRHLPDGAEPFLLPGREFAFLVH